MGTERGLDDLARRLVATATSLGANVATAESCTGGMVGAVVTGVPGSSAAYLGGCVTYSNEAKVRLLGVSAEVLERDGAVSERCAAQMAAGVRERLGATVGVSITGVAGPDGGSPEKPVGTVWIGVAVAAGATAMRYHFPGDREAVRQASAAAAISALLDALESG